MPDAQKRPCRICRRCLRPDNRVGDRQRACGEPDCQKALRQRTQASWRARNPGYATRVRQAGCGTVQQQQLLIDLADGFQSLSDAVIIVQRFADQRHLFRAQAHLAGLAAGVIDVEHPQRMAFASGALGAAAGVADEALKEGTAQDGVDAGDGVCQLGAALDCAPTCHL